MTICDFTVQQSQQIIFIGLYDIFYKIFLIWKFERRKRLVVFSATANIGETFYLLLSANMGEPFY